MPWRVAMLFGVVLGLPLVVGNRIDMSGPAWSVVRDAPGGVAVCCAAGFLGASKGREFDQGIVAVLGAIIIANVIAASVTLLSLSAGHSWSAAIEALDLPLPGMLLLGLPAGAVGAGIAIWCSHRTAQTLKR
jgi:hypothetical protein